MKRPRYKTGNPKDSIGAQKLNPGLVPDSFVAGMALAFAEGAAKYGQFNWRVSPVRFSVYDDAAMRHRMKLRAGEDFDAKTRIPHEFSIGACYAIIADARVHGTLIDDRPPAQPQLVKLIDQDYKDVQANVRLLFKAHKPVQWTEALARKAK